MGLASVFVRASSGSNLSTSEPASPLHFLPAPVLVLLALACLALAACVAGLTLGLMSLDTTGLGIVMRSNDAKQAAAARAIKPVREKGNLLLVTLLFANTIANELLPLVLEALVPGGYFSLVFSVVSIMLFGEIIPQAVCSRHPLLIGSYLIGFVKFLRIILYPVTAPIAYFLDVMLGEELATMYNREELKGLIDVHASNAVLTQDETTILKGALEFSQKSVSQILTPVANVFKLDIESQLDRETLLSILRSGHSRIPLFEHTPDNIVCLLLVKQLVLINPEDKIPIRALISNKKINHKIRVAPALECAASTLIADLLNEFQKGRSHMAIVYDNVLKPVIQRTFIGIVSIEDIIEEILQEEIIDETDNFVDNTNQTKVLVRNSEGMLVRTTAHNSHAILVPGHHAAVMVKEIDVTGLRAPLQDALRSELGVDDLEKRTSRLMRKLTAPSKSASRSSPLLGHACSGSRQLDISKCGRSLEGTALSSPKLPDTLSRTRSQPRLERPGNWKNHSIIRYAMLPGESSTALNAPGSYPSYGSMRSRNDSNTSDDRVSTSSSQSGFHSDRVGSRSARDDF